MFIIGNISCLRDCTMVIFVLDFAVDVPAFALRVVEVVVRFLCGVFVVFLVEVVVPEVVEVEVHGFGTWWVGGCSDSLEW